MDHLYYSSLRLLHPHFHPPAPSAHATSHPAIFRELRQDERRILDRYGRILREPVCAATCEALLEYRARMTFVLVKYGVHHHRMSSIGLCIRFFHEKPLNIII